MKRTIAAGLILLLLLYMATASASNAGTREDPLVTLNYLNGDYASSLKTGIEDTLGRATDRAVSRLGDIYRKHSGYRFAPGFLSLSLTPGGAVTLPTGSSFMLISGSAELIVLRGEVINISTGRSVASGEWLTLYQRYFCAENTTAQISTNTASTAQVDGYYMISSGSLAQAHKVFKDVYTGDWFFDAVSFVYDTGLFKGISDSMFSPNSTMSRAMLVTVLHRLDGIQPAGGGEQGSGGWGLGAADGGYGEQAASSGSRRFSDVPDGEWYTEAVAWASANRIVEGYDDGTFRPDTPPTREQMATIIYRYASYKGRDISATGTAYEAFPDKNEVSGYAETAMRWAVSHGVINGSDGRLLPHNSATRAQVAQIMWNYCSL